MEFRLLGPVEIVSDTGETLVLAREKEKRLLAVLLMNAGQVLSKEKLISYLADHPGGIADGTLRAYLHHVKRVLNVDDRAVELVTREGGYQLQVADDSIDVRRFTRLRHQADIAARSGKTDEAIVLLCRAEALWRGPALAGLHGQWASVTKIALEEERRSCTLRRIGLELDLGRHDELLGELRRLRAEYPDDEIRAQYEMKALYWSGRQEDALDVYRQMRERLVDQGLEPGQELVELHRRLLRSDLAPPDVIRRPQSASRVPAVPLRDTTFVGREEDIKTLTADGPGTPRTWVISGLSGIGKTRLAVEAASRMTGEVLYLEFHGKEADQTPLGTDGALRSLLEMAGVHRSALPRGRAALAALWQRELVSRKMTVILDDVPDAEAVASLLPKDGPCRVFITARRRLHGLAGASGHVLDVLPERDAIMLFREIAGEGVIDASDIVVAVRRCRHLPIAITIDAGRLRRDGSLPDFTGTLDFEGADEISEHVQLVLESCYRSLTEGEQRLFRFLGLNLCPSFTVESAAALIGRPVPATAEMISSLFDRHLVEETVNGGFRLHDLLRDYAAMKVSLDVPGRDRRDAEHRLLDWYLSHAGRAARGLFPYRRSPGQKSTSPPLQRPNPDQVAQSRTWLEAQWQNALAIAEYAERHEWKRYCVEMARVLAEFLELSGYWDEAFDAHTRALRACRDLEDRSSTARALIDLSRVALRKGLHHEAFTCAQDALELYKSVGDRQGEAIAADRMGVACYHAGNFRETLAHEQEARFLYLKAVDPIGEAEAVYRCGVACMELGRLDEALKNFRESLAISKKSGDLYNLAETLNSLGEVSRRQGYHRDAITYYRQALSIYQDMGARQEIAIVMQNIGQFYLYKGDPEKALAEFRCVLAVFRQIHDLQGQARVMCDLGDAYLTMDELEQCLFYYRQAVSVAEQMGSLHVQAVAKRGMADAYRRSDRHGEAIDNYQNAMELAQKIGDPYQQAIILNGLAESMLRVGKINMGRIYLRQASDLYQVSGAIEAESVELRLRALDAEVAGDGHLRTG